MRSLDLILVRHRPGDVVPLVIIRLACVRDRTSRSQVAKYVPYLHGRL